MTASLLDFAVEIEPFEVAASVDWQPPEPDPRRAPTLPAEVLPNGRQLRVWCRYCDRFHVHGRPEPGSDQTRRRAAHCLAADSPYLRLGYRLHEVGPVGSVPPPRRRFKPLHGRDGTIRSGLLAAQREARGRR